MKATGTMMKYEPKMNHGANSNAPMIPKCSSELPNKNKPTIRIMNGRIIGFTFILRLLLIL